MEEGKKTVCGQAGELRRGGGGGVWGGGFFPVFRPGERFFFLVGRGGRGIAAGV